MTAAVTTEYLVQKAGLQGSNWTTICRNANEEYARNIFQRQLRFYTIGRFRLVDPSGKVLEERKAMPLFSDN